MVLHIIIPTLLQLRHKLSLTVQISTMILAGITVFADLAGAAAALPQPSVQPGQADSNSTGSGTGPAPVMWLDRPVAHSALFPLIDVVVHHGGLGTTHAALAAGRQPACITSAFLCTQCTS